MYCLQNGIFGMLMLFRKLIFGIVFLFFIVPGHGQKNNSDSTQYLNLFKEFEKNSSADRKKGREIASQIEQLAINNKNHFFIADALIKKAILYYFDSDLDRSKQYALKAIASAGESNNKKVLLRAYNLIGAIYYNLADFKNSERYYLKKNSFCQTISGYSCRNGDLLQYWVNLLSTRKLFKICRVQFYCFRIF